MRRAERSDAQQQPRHGQWHLALAAAGCLLLVAGCANSVLRNAVESVVETVTDDSERNGPYAAGSHAVVAADHELGSEAGVAILRAGGNAVDAAIATAFAVCVVNPASCGIGGGGFMLIYFADSRTAVALDYRETAPAAATHDMFVRTGKADPNLSRRGGLAVAVPGEVAGLALLQQRYAKLPLSVLMEPAIRLARDGFPAGKHLANTIAANVEALRSSPALARVFLRADGSPKVEGDLVRRPELARTLERIAVEGASAFYQGAIADDLVQAARAGGGVLSTTDLASYRPVWRDPIHYEFRGDDIIAMPPPSSAGVLLEVLGMIEHDDLRAMGHDSADYAHLLAEAMKHGFADRARLYGDPRGTAVPLPKLLSKENTTALRRRIDMGHTQDPASYGTTPGGMVAVAREHGTSHLSVIDAQGNAVACTTTINTSFGSMLVGEHSGVILNNEMDDFSAQPGTPNAFGLVGAEANSIAPGKRPLSSMSPTIVVRDGKAVLAVGASGGPLILSATLQALLNATIFDLDAAAAVSAPRLHHQWLPPVLSLEPSYPTTPRASLEARGQKLGPLPLAGAVQLVQRRGSRLEGASDPRKGGAAAAW